MHKQVHEAPGGFKYYERWDGLYQAGKSWSYWSPRYSKRVKIKDGQVRNGANVAMDIDSLSWWVHDQLCADGVWNDGTDVTPWQACCVLGDILREEGRWFRATTWKYTTLVFGCKRSREKVGD